MIAAMRKFFISAAALMVALGPAGLSAAPVPLRIVSLKPNVTDIVYALGAGERLVGVTRFCDVPAGAPRPEVVADYTRAFIEPIVALGPNVVIGSRENSSRKSIEAIERTGIAVRLFPFTTLSEALSSIRAIGSLLGADERGESLAAGMEEAIRSIEGRWRGSEPVRALIVWGLKPLVVAGRGTYMDELLNSVGAANAVGRTNLKYPRIGLEELIASDPDAIVDLSMGSEAGGGTSRPWSGIESLRAVREGRVYRLDASEFRAGPRLPDALEKLAGLMHGAR